MNAPFRAALELTADPSDNPDVQLFHAQLGELWTIGPKAHGGLLLALCAHAAEQALGVAGVEPLAVSASFLSPPDPGAVQLRAVVTKRGRTVSLVEVQLRQGARTAVQVVVTLGPAETGAGPFERAHPLQELPVDPPSDTIDVRAHPMGDIVNVSKACEMRVDPTTAAYLRGEVASDPVIRLWVRPTGEDPDALFALMAGDVAPPVTLNLGRQGWAPTVQLTALLRAQPAPGWLRVEMSTSVVGGTWFDGDAVVIDSKGTMVCQARQLAMAPAPAAPLPGR
ncbi:thioesterase family protein [Rhodococcus sp. X156]|uniref:thioesterase family protein n=1 Tax=Rhodococcus sp. X156 TaxID=2499145 RepID=UPI000FD93F18|nr:thioesterase family protein [Rhodococcus sp. X156]